MKIYISDLREVKEAWSICTPGVVQFFKMHNLDMREFLKNGIDAEKLLATNDEIAIRLVRAVEKKNGKQ